MKYRDNGFIKYQDKQRNGEVGIYSNRSETRESRNKYSKFYNRFLFKDIDRYWWNNLKDSDKDKIITTHNYQVTSLNNINGRKFINNRRGMGLFMIVDHYQTFNTMDEWFSYIKQTFKPNISNLRQDKLKLLGIK